MPLYMDRHDVSDTVTAENVAQLHQEDLKIQHRYNCRGLTYWFDEKRKTAFCLIEAPDEETLKEMHNHAHGQVPNSIIEVNAGIVESFLGRIEDPKKAGDAGLNIIDDPAFRTIMTIVLQPSLPITAAKDIKLALTDYRATIINILTTYEEKPVRNNGNNFLVSFKSVTNAVHAALAISEELKALSKRSKHHRVGLKIGLDAGVPVTGKKSFFEETIRLTEWMCETVEGELIFSPVIKELYKSENSNEFITGENLVILSRDDANFITQLMVYMDAAWSDSDLKVDDFCKPVGYSKSQLYRKMISLTGRAPNTFIREYRLQQALNLLEKNAGNVSEIAFKTGFTSPSYFSKCFQKKFGYAPSDHADVNGA